MHLDKWLHDKKLSIYDIASLCGITVQSFNKFRRQKEGWLRERCYIASHGQITDVGFPELSNLPCNALRRRGSHTIIISFLEEDHDDSTDEYRAGSIISRKDGTTVPKSDEYGSL
jgi:hypothetical protein